jgi:hypothetical protein
MVDCEQASFLIERNPGGDLRIMWTGVHDYADLICTAFPSVRFSSVFEDRFGKFDWGVFAKGVSAADEAVIRTFCGMLGSAVWLRDDLDQSFALSMHGNYVGGSYQRTPMGQLVYDAKPYSMSGSVGSTAKADELAAHMATFIRSNPAYRAALAVAAVPPSNPNKPFDLPTYVASKIATFTGKVDISGAVRKTRVTRPMKDCQTEAEKTANIHGAFVVDPKVVGGKRVILVDDIYDSGRSLNEMGRVVRASGASVVLGLTATKTRT